eukprot:Seg2847.6 transcript_id=Seg2847.6/GoldUCD/mRNA.D3Y31 product="ER membrane protein complex subunit 10" protein_id=Seg2847.6/GoldUCD/D3Y31
MASRECLILSVCLLIFSTIIAKKVDEDFEPPSHSSFSLPLQHAFELGDDAKFAPRGSVVFKTLRSSHASLAREVSLTSEEYEKLEELVRNDGVYRIRAPAKIGDSLDKPDAFYVSTFVKACHLLYSGLSEIITVSIDSSGNVIGISLRTDKKECPQNLDEVEMKLDGRRTFNTTVHVQLQSSGAVPDTQVFVRKIEREEAEKLAGKEKDNRSFLAKYWMYILPAVFIMMLAGQQDPNEGQGS